MLVGFASSLAAERLLVRHPEVTSRPKRRMFSLTEIIVILAVVGTVWSALRANLALAGAFIALTAAAVVGALLRKSYRLRRAGYLVARRGTDQIRYEELVDGTVRSLTIDGEMLVGAPFVVYLPDREAWEKKIPAWAQSRRDEIIERVREGLGADQYQFEEYQVRDA